MTPQQHRFLLILLALAMVVLSYWVHQDAFGRIALCYSVAFCAYLYAGVRAPRSFDSHSKLNLLVKLVLVVALPLGSDDIYRFYWDGWCVLEHISPYRYLPQDLPGRADYDWATIYPLLNSPHYYSVYPPILQVIFAFCAWISAQSIHLFSICWKLILLIADLGTIYLLKKSLPDDKQNLVWWYAWNPLILYEILANGHSEGLMLYFIIAAIYWLQRSKFFFSAVMFAISAAVKLFPIILLPFVFKYLGYKKGLPYVLIVIMLFSISMLAVFPYYDHFLASVRLYMSSFEFNGSVFELWKAIDYQRFGFDNIGHIGRYLSTASIIWLIVIFLRQKSHDWDSILSSILLLWTGYLLLSTTVHPWYVLPLILLGVLRRWVWPIAWSGLIMLSYSWYDPGISKAWKYALIGLEYGGLLTFYLSGRYGWLRFDRWGGEEKPD
ncbi:MAG: glycosyltransferase family 87 protein [Saprospiraceae bacterium]